ncbi:hypothetical protein CALCODRAFT_490980 [Calocera cornea HHB12733]|uniref:Uncharacterized protein n=1 Tax=Calocera cornea HHB12733 TaxID=1353952 RepID=A0A165JE59_9BASI|nr:hypothetical protein CALCODRAFT_490980 [Calocera cornea HHB12733]
MIGLVAPSGALLSQTPSFLLSPTYPLLFLAGEVLVYFCPPLPSPSLPTELPLSVLDAFTRVGLLTTLAFGPIVSHPVREVAQSPLALILASILLANGGFFLVSCASMLSPHGWKVATPNELRPWGWTAVDLWSAGLVTSAFAIMTDAQPWWSLVRNRLLHTCASLFLGSKSYPDGSKLNTDEARSICLLILIVLFAARALWNHGSPFLQTLRTV